MIEPNTLEDRIRKNLPDVEHLDLQDLTGTKDHYEATIVSQAFIGKTRVEQHRLVYEAIGELMNGPVHALALKTYTPDAYRKAQGG